jgi:hypothetical protein
MSTPSPREPAGTRSTTLQLALPQSGRERSTRPQLTSKRSVGPQLTGKRSPAAQFTLEPTPRLKLTNGQLTHGQLTAPRPPGQLTAAGPVGQLTAAGAPAAPRLAPRLTSRLTISHPAILVLNSGRPMPLANAHRAHADLLIELPFYRTVIRSNMCAIE